MPLDYSSIELTEQEMKEAILEAKKKKYFRLKHSPYWEEKLMKSIQSVDPEIAKVIKDKFMEML